MSLTSFLTSPISKSFRNKLKADFPRPRISLNTPMIAHPQTKNYSIIGTAFDYLMRFKLERMFGSEKSKKHSWLAEKIIERLSKVGVFKEMKLDEFRDLYGENPPPEDYLKWKIKLKNLQDRERWQTRKDFYIKTKGLFKKAKEDYHLYMLTGKFTKSLGQSTIVLAKLDLVGRAGIFDNTIDTYVEKDIQDLENLYKAIPIERFRPSESIILNPTFGEGSSMFLGADADLIIDHTLIDIKTTKKLVFSRAYINQLLCYTFASRIGGINEDESLKEKIQSIGIYFSRFGLLYTIPLADFGSKQDFQTFTQWIPEFFDNIFGPN